MTNPTFEAIPEYDPLPKTAAGRGPGISADLTKTKAKDLIDADIAVTGFMIIPNQFIESDSDPKEVTMIEIMDAAGDSFYFVHGSKVLMQAVEARQELGQIPFKTRLTFEEGKNGRSYYAFA